MCNLPPSSLSLVVCLDETPLVAVTGRALLLAVPAGRNDAEASVAGTARARITARMSATSCTPRPATHTQAGDHLAADHGPGRYPGVCRRGAARFHAARWWLACCLNRPRCRAAQSKHRRVGGAPSRRCLAAAGVQRGGVLGDQAVLLELADVAVEIGGVDAEFRGDVLDGNAGTVADQTQDVLLTARLGVAARPAFPRR